MVYQKCHCAEHLIFSPLTSPFFLRGELFYYHTHALQSSSALSCLLLPCPALPVLLTNLQTEELSQLGAKEGIWVGTAGGKGEERKGSELHWQSRWAWAEELGLTWEGEEGKSSLLEQAFQSCFAQLVETQQVSGASSCTSFLSHWVFVQWHFLFFLNIILPEKFYNTLWEPR